MIVTEDTHSEPLSEYVPPESRKPVEKVTEYDESYRHYVAKRLKTYLKKRREMVDIRDELGKDKVRFQYENGYLTPWIQTNDFIRMCDYGIMDCLGELKHYRKPK